MIIKLKTIKRGPFQIWKSKADKSLKRVLGKLKKCFKNKTKNLENFEKAKMSGKQKVPENLKRCCVCLQLQATRGPFVEQKFMLSSSLRCYQLHNCQIYDFGHPLLSYLSWT